MPYRMQGAQLSDPTCIILYCGDNLGRMSGESYRRLVGLDRDVNERFGWGDKYICGGLYIVYCVLLLI